MKANKIILTGIALSLSIGLVACNKRVKNSIDNLSENSGQTVAQNDYVEKYSRFYGDNFSDLNTYKKYKTPQETIEYYKDKEYPGNEEYVSELKNDYTDTKTKIQNFIDYIKNDLPTDNKELTDLKNKLVYFITGTFLLITFPYFTYSLTPFPLKITSLFLYMSLFCFNFFLDSA